MRDTLAGTVICARDSHWPWLDKLYIEKCKRWPSLSICKSIPDESINYYNEDPRIVSHSLTEDDCGEACCTATLKIHFEEGLSMNVCGPGWNFASFVPDAPILEAIAVGVPNIEECPTTGFIYPDLLQTDGDCTLQSDGTYNCD